MIANKNFKTFLTVALIFLLPVLLAKVILTQGWYSSKTTNHGLLISPNLSYRDLSLTNPINKLWQIVYVLPSQCDAMCSEQLHLLQQSHVALGREQERVQNVIMVQRGFVGEQLKQLKSNDKYRVVEMSPNVIRKLGNKRLLIADPLGNFVLHYPLSDQFEERLLTQRDLLKDLKKLLKLSKVG